MYGSTIKSNYITYGTGMYECLRTGTSSVPAYKMFSDNIFVFLLR
jgi:hypothetical protein